LVKIEDGTSVNKHVFVIIVFLLLPASLMVCVQASTTFTVPPLSEQTVRVNLNQGDSVKGAVSVSGGTGTGVDFLVSDPNGKQLLSYNYTTYTTFSFSASMKGTYTLSFDNSFCSCAGGKNITLDYTVNIKPVQGGLDVGSNAGFSLVIILILVIVIVAITAIVILMRHSRTNTDTAKVSPMLNALSERISFYHKSSSTE
jgi:emp24/gp25L/p24 family/GOLD